jgi:hypothetical protein
MGSAAHHKALRVDAVVVDGCGHDLPTIVKREPNHCFVHSTLHSKWLRHSPIRGGLTIFEGIAVS